MNPNARQVILRTACFSVALSLLLLPTGVNVSLADNEDIYTVYSIEKNGCTTNLDELIQFTEYAIKGPDFSCKLSEGTPAGSGMLNYTGMCTVDGKELEDYVTFDLGNYQDRFEVSLPGRDDWTKMYPCTDVEGLTR